jgi:hypothetical protein
MRSNRPAAKPRRRISHAITLATIGMMATTLVAQDSTSGLATPTVDPIQRLEPASYMGVSSSIASRQLREQSKLPRGVGVVVDYVQADSPADKAGIKVGDVVHKLDDQFIVNAHQFTTLIRMRQPGDVVKLAIVRGGEPALVEVELVSKDLPPLDESIGLIVPPDLRDAPPMPRPGTGEFTGVMTFSDTENSITITASDTRRTVVIKDLAGGVVYEGALNNDADRSKIPEKLRVKVDRVEQGADRVRELRQTGGPVAADTTADD